MRYKSDLVSKQPWKSATFGNVRGLRDGVSECYLPKSLSFQLSEALKGVVLAGESNIASIRAGMPEVKQWKDWKSRYSHNSCFKTLSTRIQRMFTAYSLCNDAVR